MADDEDGINYEVESVTRARVMSKKRCRYWEYRVKWKGYSRNEDTWEPMDSFLGSEHILDQFWDRVKTGGRDHNDLSLFKLYEELFPVGPPNRKNKRPVPKVPVERHPLAGPSSNTGGKRKRAASGSAEIEPSPAKRTRSSEKVQIQTDTPPSLRKPATNFPLPGRSKVISNSQRSTPISSRNRIKPGRWEHSTEVIPDSDDDYKSPGEDPIDIERNGVPGASTSVNDDKQPICEPGNSAEESQVPNTPPKSLPKHRTRATEPLVKMIDFHGTANGNSTKSRVVAKTGASTRAKPGPGRSSAGMKKSSSLLTYGKKGLHTVKRAVSASNQSPIQEQSQAAITISDDEVAVEPNKFSSPSEPAPSVTELLEMAGLKEDLEQLQDFKEEYSSTVFNKDLNGFNNLFPATSSATIAAAPPNGSASWQRPTIFGPLGSGSDATSVNQPTTSHIPFKLQLDPQTHIVVALKDIAPSDPPTLYTVVQNIHDNGPSGQFYHRAFTTALLDVLRTGGSSGRVDAVPESSDSEKSLFAKFKTRLDGGDIFVMMAAKNMMVFCSSDNEHVARLNLPASVLALRQSVVVSLVNIDNNSGYLDVALNHANSW